VRKGLAIPANSLLSNQGYATLTGHSPKNNLKTVRKGRAFPHIRRQSRKTERCSLFCVSTANRSFINSFIAVETQESIGAGVLYHLRQQMGSSLNIKSKDVWKATIMFPASGDKPAGQRVYKMERWPKP
jgi:hypothetical protein